MRQLLELVNPGLELDIANFTTSQSMFNSDYNHNNKKITVTITIITIRITTNNMGSTRIAFILRESGTSDALIDTIPSSRYS